MIRHIPRGIAWASPCSCSCSRGARVRVRGKRARDVSIDLGVWIRQRLLPLCRESLELDTAEAPVGLTGEARAFCGKHSDSRRTRDPRTRTLASLEHEHEHELA